MSHTPGPWVMEYEPEIDIDEVRQDGQQVSAAGGYSGENYFTGRILEAETGEAIADWVSEGNARLLAAAPELLECLKHIQGIVSESQGVAGWHQNGQVASWDELGLREEIDAVLAKVRGEKSE